MRTCLALLFLVLGLAGCGGDDGDADTSAAAPATAATETAAGVDATADSGCRAVEQPAGMPEGTGKAPAAILNAAKTYRVTVKTSCGDFTITLDLEAAPKTTASFVALAEADFYDGTFFHRIVPGFVIQGGDPTGTGSGGPGYSTVDTPAPDTAYTKGVVAMAKTAAEAPGTSGSQFFIVTAEDAGLPPDYAVIGKVSGGEDVVARIAVLGDPGSELPTQPVVIDDMLVQAS